MPFNPLTICVRGTLQKYHKLVTKLGLLVWSCVSQDPNSQVFYGLVNQTNSSSCQLEFLYANTLPQPFFRSMGYESGVLYNLNNVFYRCS